MISSYFGSDFEDELLERLLASGTIGENHDLNCFERVLVVRESSTYFIGQKAHRLVEIDFETQKLRPDGVWQKSFFLNRSVEYQSSCLSRCGSKVRVKLRVIEYFDALSLERKAQDNIPYIVGSIKPSCFVLSTDGTDRILQAAQQILEKLPESWFDDVRKLDRLLIPVFAFQFVQRGYVVFDPFLNASKNLHDSEELVGVSLNHTNAWH